MIGAHYTRCSLTYVGDQAGHLVVVHHEVGVETSPECGGRVGEGTMLTKQQQSPIAEAS